MATLNTQMVSFQVPMPLFCTSYPTVVHGLIAHVFSAIIPISSHYYPLVNIQQNYGTSPSLIGKSTINGPFSIAILNYQRVSHNDPIVYSIIYY
jgi:hypothetical protein